MPGIKTKTLLLSALCLTANLIHSAGATERITITPGNGASLQGTRTYSGVVMAAYQKVYAMNFEIWKPGDLPAGWYATFDGFPVAQIAENRWVYGQIGLEGVIRPTNVLVGSVVPDKVPGLVRVAAMWNYAKYIDNPEFLKVQNYNCNRMGWLDLDKYNASTLIAWNTRQIGVWLWLGNRWRRFFPNSGEYTWQMIKRIAPYISKELRKADAWYLNGEPEEVANLARQWGWIWGGKVVLESLKAYRDSGGNEGNVTSMSSSSSSSSGGGSNSGNNNNSSGQWDVD